MSTLRAYTGSILRINLSTDRVQCNHYDEAILRQFVGGPGLAVKILYDELLPGIDPFSPETPLIFMTGPLTGTAVPGACQYAVVSKSPMTGFTVGLARSKGFFAPELKFAGFDGIVVVGQAEYPVYIWIDKQEVSIRDASDLRGEDVYETERKLREELGDDKIKVACIGPAGEVLARMACIMNDRYHAAGRGGLGAVMGSKKLKAIAVRGGSHRINIDNKARFLEIAKKWRKLSSNSSVGKAYREYGTTGDYQRYEARHLIGDLPTKNLTTCVFPEWKKLSAQHMNENFPVTKTPAQCFGCNLLHDRLIEIQDGPFAGLYAYPEYEDSAAWGSNIGISETSEMIILTDLANRYGIDSVECSFTISLAMECYEKGLITKEDIDGVRLEWGNFKAVLTIMDKIAQREGIGDILAEGTRRTAEHIGKGSKDFAVCIKNTAPMQHDLRSNWGMLLGYSVGSTGPVHEGVGVDLSPDADIGFPNRLPRFSVERKAEACRKTQLKRFLIDNLGLCIFPTRGGVASSLIVDAFSEATGWLISVEEAYKAAERTVNLIRAFNIRNGLKPIDDWPSKRLLEPPVDGGAKGMTAAANLGRMVTDYYKLMGWDEKMGKPLAKTLRRLDLEYVIEDIW